MPCISLYAVMLDLELSCFLCNVSKLDSELDILVELSWLLLLLLLAWLVIWSWCWLRLLLTAE